MNIYEKNKKNKLHNYVCDISMEITHYKHQFIDKRIILSLSGTKTKTNLRLVILTLVYLLIRFKKMVFQKKDGFFSVQYKSVLMILWTQRSKKITKKEEI